MIRSAGLAAALLLILASGPVSALTHDLDLSRMVLDSNNDPWLGNDPYNTLFGANRDSPLANQNFFRSLAAELGLAFAPKFLAPAETLGHNGFDIGIEWSLTGINNSEPYWNGPCDTGSTCAVSSYIEDDRQPKSVLTTGQVHIRKGLPFSFELGGTASYLLYTEMAAVGIELKWALNEGFYYIPDIAIRGSGTRVFGSKGIDLTLGGFDISISKAFGLGDTVSLTPYAGYNFLYIRAASYVLDATPGVSPGTSAASDWPAEMPSNYPGTLDQWTDDWKVMNTAARNEFLSTSSYPTQYRENQDPQGAPLARPIKSMEDRMFFSFDAEGLVTHRQFLGLRFKAHILELAAEFVFAEVPEADLGSSFIWQFSTKLGLDF